jgi:hypothetical protein
MPRGMLHDIADEQRTPIGECPQPGSSAPKRLHREKCLFLVPQMQDTRFPQQSHVEQNYKSNASHGPRLSVCPKNSPFIIRVNQSEDRVRQIDCRGGGCLPV